MALDLIGRFADLYKGLDGFIELFDPAREILDAVETKRLPACLKVHKPIPIATYIPKFESSSSSYMRRQDPDRERNEAAKLRNQYKEERKGAIRELRKDARFLATVEQEKQKEKDRAYHERMKRVFGSLEGERAEQKAMDREKAKDKRRSGRKLQAVTHLYAQPRRRTLAGDETTPRIPFNSEWLTAVDSLNTFFDMVPSHGEIVWSDQGDLLAMVEMSLQVVGLIALRVERVFIGNDDIGRKTLTKLLNLDYALGHWIDEVIPREVTTLRPMVLQTILAICRSSMPPLPTREPVQASFQISWKKNLTL
ncbi:nucleolar complex protein [Salix suchowensis]|nr:nucleolar complex protein [Salix suchowensis]